MPAITFERSIKHKYRPTICRFMSALFSKGHLSVAEVYIEPRKITYRLNDTSTIERYYTDQRTMYTVLQTILDWVERDRIAGNIPSSCCG